MSSTSLPFIYMGTSLRNQLHLSRSLVLGCGLILAGVTAMPAAAMDNAELAKQTLNPVAALISVPLQANYDDNIGPHKKGDKWQLNVQPVIPVSINQDWNLISRTIVPLIDQDGALPNGAADASGVGDVTQSFFFSPKRPTESGWIWGAGPVLLLPTGSDDLLSADKWGLGPTAVFLKQADGWTYGALLNHIWSVASSGGGDDKADINATFMQPFLSYTTKSFTTFGINTESTYNWETDQWSVPLNLSVTQLLKIGNQPVSIQAAARYWAQSPDKVGPEGWGFRFVWTFLFPK